MEEVGGGRGGGGAGSTSQSSATGIERAGDRVGRKGGEEENEDRAILVSEFRVLRGKGVKAMQRNIGSKRG